MSDWNPTGGCGSGGEMNTDVKKNTRGTVPSVEMLGRRKSGLWSGRGVTSSPTIGAISSLIALERKRTRRGENKWRRKSAAEKKKGGFSLRGEIAPPSISATANDLRSSCCRRPFQSFLRVWAGISVTVEC